MFLDRPTIFSMILSGLWIYLTTSETFWKLLRRGRHGPPGRQDTKGTRWMPWHRKSTKGAASCDKLRGGANGRRFPQVPEWGNPSGAMPAGTAARIHRAAGGNRGN